MIKYEVTPLELFFDLVFAFAISHVVLGARRIVRIKSLADELNRKGGKALAVSTDVTYYDQVKKLVDTAFQTFGRIDVMINNAGLMPHSPIERRSGQYARSCKN